MSQTTSRNTPSAQPKKLSDTLQRVLLGICARTLSEVLVNHHKELDPKYIWRLKGAIRVLQGQEPDRRRG